MKSAHLSPRFLGWLEDIHRIGTATVDNALSGVPLNFSGYRGDGIIGGGNKDKLGIISHSLIVIKYLAALDCLRQLPG